MDTYEGFSPAFMLLQLSSTVDGLSYDFESVTTIGDAILQLVKFVGELIRIQSGVGKANHASSVVELKLFTPVYNSAVLYVEFRRIVLYGFHHVAEGFFTF